MMAWVFGLLAALAFLGCATHSIRRNGHGMIYAAVLCMIWLALLAWWTGRLG